MRRLIVGFFAAVGILATLVVVGVVVLWYWVRPPVKPVAESTVVTLALDQGFAEVTSTDGVARLLGGEQSSLRDVLDGLEGAGNDPRVKGLFVRIGSDEIGMAQVQELRDAVAAFRAKGKFAIAYADTFGEFGPGTHAYYLATAFDEIWLQPLGLVSLIGLRSEQPFFRGALDKLDIVPQLDHRSEYKSAMNTITDRAMAPPQREEMEAIVRSVYGQVVRGIAESRHIDEAQVRALVDRAPLLTAEATEAHLVDHVGYRDQAESAARGRAGDGAQTLALRRYLSRIDRPHQNGPTIALIYATGLIQRGSSTNNPLSGAGLLGADTVVRAFDQAARDQAVRAILFRIDSPGGSAVASETIWRAVLRAHERGKPIVVSMGNLAGSGGYYIAAAADKIVAEPATLTGSIGVVAGKFITTGLWTKLGVTWDAVGLGDNSAMFSTLEDFSPQGRARFETFLDDVYGGFKDRVAKGRKLDEATVERVARGRVWTGEDAKSRGLVDALGGFSTALALAKEAAGIPADQDVTIELVPPPEGPAELIARALGRGPEDERVESGGAGTLARALRELRGVLQQVELAREPPGSAAMPPIKAP